MKKKRSLATVGAIMALSLISGNSAFAESKGTENPMEEAQAFLASPTSMSQAIAAAEAASGGKVSGIEFQIGEDGAPDLIMADVVLADGTEKTVAINPADGKVMNITLAENDQQGDEQDGEDSDGEQDGENANN
ncbi:phosphatidylinositol 3-kinase-related protein kinase [Rhodobacter ferrooxidans]|uniref:Phosphatidylinositol 3-kinase-related protein kinase n=2 Tax=Rhodobacter ferrooxidans TaxID=371731 RepID=C8S1X7_9RHOB|nr:phosphatidylinositol 3-kinase-related protein kinase [Rhodobacter sp. SW2]